MSSRFLSPTVRVSDQISLDQLGFDPIVLLCSYIKKGIILVNQVKGEIYIERCCNTIK